MGFQLLKIIKNLYSNNIKRNGQFKVNHYLQLLPYISYLYDCKLQPLKSPFTDSAYLSLHFKSFLFFYHFLQ